jgi:hypothetical protein
VGILICPHHGHSGIVLVCPHVRQAVVEVTPLPHLHRAKADYEGLVISGDLCPDCAARATSDGGGLERSGDEGADWLFGSLTAAVCGRCLDEQSMKKWRWPGNGDFGN